MPCVRLRHLTYEYTYFMLDNEEEEEEEKSKVNVKRDVSLSALELPTQSTQAWMQ